MKKFTLLILFILIFQGLNAQEEEITNKYVLGGTINFSTQNNAYPFSTFSVNSGIGGIFSSSSNDIKNANFAISPYIGKEINSHWVGGIQIDLRRAIFKFRNAQSSSGEFERKSSQIGFGIFARYMFNPENKFVFFLQPSLEYNALKEEEYFQSELDQESKSKFIEARINLGVVYNINEKFRLILRAGGLFFVDGKWEEIDTDNEIEFSSFSANLNLSNIFFGFEMRI